MNSNVQRYFVGFVQRDDEDPNQRAILNTCFAWYDGKKSAMWRFYAGEHVKPGHLAREASKALLDCEPEDDERLRQLQTWARRQEGLCRAAQSLRDAHDELRLAAEVAGIDQYLTEEIRRTAEPLGAA